MIFVICHIMAMESEKDRLYRTTEARAGSHSFMTPVASCDSDRRQANARHRMREFKVIENFQFFFEPYRSCERDESMPQTIYVLIATLARWRSWIPMVCCCQSMILRNTIRHFDRRHESPQGRKGPK